MNVTARQLNDRNPLNELANERATDICAAISDKIDMAHSEGRPHIDIEIDINDGTGHIHGMKKMVTSFVITKVEEAGFTIEGFRAKDNQIVWRVSGWEGFSSQQILRVDNFINQKLKKK